mgnify:CR=1 FL=1
MSKKKAIVQEEIAAEPVAPVTYCSIGDLVGTPRPDGGVITRVNSDDEEYIIQAAEAVTVALVDCPDPTTKVAACAARWANVVGAVDLRCLGEAGPATASALSVLRPSSEVDDADG